MRAVTELAGVRATFKGWPSIAAKGFLWKHFELPRREIVIRSRGGTSIVAPLVHNVGALYGALEVFALRAYDHEWQLEQAPVILDIGANIGAWTLWVSEKRPGARGTCYEPDPAAAAYLRRNLELNGLQAQVDVRTEAVSDQTGTASLFQAHPGEGSSSLQQTSPVATFDRETTVPTVSFNEVVGRIESEEISIVKMDCEGAEYDILEHSSADAWARVKRVVLEYHPTAPGRHDHLRQRFAELGFSEAREDRRPGGLGTLWLARAHTPSE